MMRALPPLGASFGSALITALSVQIGTLRAVLSAGLATVVAARRPGLDARADSVLQAVALPSGGAGTQPVQQSPLPQ